jgi:hypothetical protein
MPSSITIQRGGKVRVLVAQGPAQLTFCLATWEYLAGRHDPADSASMVDILVLGGFCAGQEVGSEMDQMCRQIASIWKFAKIVSTTDLDYQFQAGQLSFQGYLDEIRRLIGHERVAEVYVCRNMQPLNEAVLWSYRKARKVCYGDLSYIDLDDTSWCQPLRPEGYVPLDEIQCVGPQEITPGLFDRLPLTNVPAIHLTRILRSASSACPQLSAFCKQLDSDGKSPRILVCLSNLTESVTVKCVEDEIDFYYDCLKPHLAPGALVIIKGHPRETLQQSRRLADRLSEQGVEVRSLSAFSVVPVDFIACQLRIDLFISLVSCSAIWWRLLQPESTLMIGVPRPLLDRYFTPASMSHLTWKLAAPQVFLQTWMATQGSFQPFRLSAVQRCLDMAPESPILLPGKSDATTSSPAPPLDPGLQSFFEAVLAQSPPACIGFWQRLSRLAKNWFAAVPQTANKAP